MHRRDVEIFEDFTAWEAAARIEAFKSAGGQHLVPLVHAVAHFDCRVAVIWQRSPKFRFYGPRPTIGIVGDDTDRALGPDGFHRKSVTRFLETCRSISIVSSGPEPIPYAAALGAAILARKNTAIIETRPERAYEWEALAQQAAPDAQFIFCRVRAH